MFTGGSDDEAVCIRVFTQAGTGKSTSKGMRISAVLIMSNAQNRPHINLQKNIFTAAVPARDGYSAISLQDYSRISDQRSEFLNFLLAPNPAGVTSVSEYGVLKAA